ncbi:MAG TPA: DUF1015 family protein [Myxococcota bacterium]
MPSIRAFRGLRFVQNRVDYGAVVAPASPTDPRHVAHLLDATRKDDDGKDAPLRRARLRLAEWQRAGLLARDAQPAMYAVHRKSDDGEATGLFCALSVDAATAQPATRGDDTREARLGALALAVEPVVATFTEPRVKRTVDNAVDREADAAWRVGGTSYELWCVDEESTTARIATLLSQAPIAICANADALAAQAAWWKRTSGNIDDDRPRAGAYALAFLHADDERWPEVPVGAALLPLRGMLE